MVGLEALFVEVRHKSHHGGVQPLRNHHHHCERACHGDSAREVGFQAKAGGMVQWTSGITFLIETLPSNNHQYNVSMQSKSTFFRFSAAICKLCSLWPRARAAGASRDVIGITHGSAGSSSERDSNLNYNSSHFEHQNITKLFLHSNFVEKC